MIVISLKNSKLCYCDPNYFVLCHALESPPPPFPTAPHFHSWNPYGGASRQADKLVLAVSASLRLVSSARQEFLLSILLCIRPIVQSSKRLLGFILFTYLGTPMKVHAHVRDVLTSVFLTAWLASAGFLLPSRPAGCVPPYTLITSRINSQSALAAT